MGDYSVRKVKMVERYRGEFVEFANNERQVVVKPSLKFDENGKLVK